MNIQRISARNTDSQRGFTLLVSILVIGIVLAIGLSILNITLKEYLLSGIARESAIAFYAADAGMECAFYWDRSPDDGDKFDVTGEPAAPPLGTPIECMGRQATVGGASSGDPQRLQFSWGGSGNPEVCARVTVIKYFSAFDSVPMGFNAAGEPIACPAGVECTRVESRGYNKACPATIDTPFDDSRTVERALRALY